MARNTGTSGAPATRRFQWRNFAVSVTVPGRIAALGRRNTTADPDTPVLEFAKRVPTVHVVQRDVDAALGAGRTPEDEARETAAKPEGLAGEVASVFAWYHTIELPGGVVTPGVYDHRPLLPHYGIPDDLSGQRVLDVATFDGFWAFEFERRGAGVVALDIARWAEMDHAHGVRERRLATGRDGETGQGFAIAAKALGSKVDRRTTTVYDLNPDDFGMFDLVHVGDLLLHVRDPLRALEAIRSVTRGRAHIVDSINNDLHGAPGQLVTEYLGGWRGTMWWLPSLDTLAQMVIDAGFSDVKVDKLFRLDLRHTTGAWRAIMNATP